MEFALTRLPRIRKSLDLKNWVNAAFLTKFKVLDVSHTLSGVEAKNPLLSLTSPEDADFTDLFVQEAIKNYPALSERQTEKKVVLFLSDWREILAYYYKNRHTIPFTVGQQLKDIVSDVPEADQKQGSVPVPSIEPIPTTESSPIPVTEPVHPLTEIEPISLPPSSASIPATEPIHPLAEIEHISLADAIGLLPKLSDARYYIPIARSGKENKQALDAKLDFLRKHITELSNIPTSVPAPPSSDVRVRIIERMHFHFSSRERLTKGQVSKLGLALGIVDEGYLWEAVELAWVLWYRKINEQQKAFEERFAEMVDFYYHIQPTYAYSDSSKMLFQQYSTSGPLAALACWYANTDQAQSIFEPSAGNGLLVIGAPYQHTTVNEIDPQRLQSLRYQPFPVILQQDGSQPFTEFFHRFEVVLTNPPFGTWREEADIKEQFSKEFMGGFRGTNRVRLDHVMGVHALNTMKDTGKAVLIIGGWFDFGPDGHIRKHVAFFNWLYYFYQVDDIININQFKMYFKQGAAQNSELMMILIGGRKQVPGFATPNVRSTSTQLRTVAYDFPDVLERVRVAKSLRSTAPSRELSTPTTELVVEQLYIEVSE